MRTTLLIIIILSALDCFCQINARIIRVKDGDTFTAQWKGKIYDCRLANIDAPELKQSFGTASRDSLSHLIAGKMISLDSLKKDLYGRIIVNARLGNTRLDSLMIRKGWAWHYGEYSRDEMLKHCMLQACNEGAGLWSCGKFSVCPPWLYRKYNHQNRLRYCKGC